MNNFETLTTAELLNVKGGEWDGRCGVKHNGSWTCGTGPGFTFDDVTYSYNYDAGTTGWCCASCGDSNKCGEASSGGSEVSITGPGGGASIQP